MDMPNGRRPGGLGGALCRLASSLAICAAVALWAGGCEKKADDAPVDPAEDAGPTQDGPEEIPLSPLPDFTLAMDISVLSGNAPLAVDFAPVVTGELGIEDLTYHWALGETTTYDEPTFTHTFYLATTANVTLTAKHVLPDGRVVTEVAEGIVRILGCADLRFDQISLSPPVDVAPGDEVTFKLGALVNDGDAVELPFEVWIVLSADDILDLEEDLVVHKLTYDDIPSGLYTDVSVPYADLTFVVPDDVPDDNYYVFLVADPDERINECQESNNVTQSTNNLTVDKGIALKPDLVASDVDFPEGLVVNQGQNINYGFKIGNEGEGEAGKFRLAAWLSTDAVLDDDDIVMSAPDEIGATVQQMAVNHVQSFFKSYKIPADLPDGAYWVIVKADTNDELAEEDEENNVAVSPWPLNMQYEEPQCFDFAMAELLVTPKATYWNGSVQVKTTVSNPGAIEAPAGAIFRVYFSQQQTLNPSVSLEMASLILGAIPPGGSVEIDEVVPVGSSLPVLPHYVGAIVDPDAQFAECTESNNAQMFPTAVSISAIASVDLEVNEVDFHPSTVKAGQDIKVTSLLTNLGSSSATAFKLGVIFSEDPSFSQGEIKSGKDLVVYTAVVGTVDAGCEVARVDKVHVPLALEHTIGTYYVAVIADVDEAISADKVKGNNIASALNPLTVLEPQGGCFEDDQEPNDTLGNAAALTAGLHEALGSCGDDDWYSVQVPAGHSLLVDLTAYELLSLQPVAADVDMALYDAGGQQLSASTNVGDTESVHAFTVPGDAAYFIRVYPKGLGAQARYDLDVNVLGPVDGIDLLPADVVALPATLYPGGLMNTTWQEVNLGDQPADSYEARIWASLDTELDPSVDVLVATVQVDGAAAQDQDQHSAEFLLPDEIDGGYWRFLVHSDAGGVIAEADETNNVAASDTVYLDPQLTCADDSYEPNNAAAIATPLDLGEGSLTIGNLTVCPQLDDWYAVGLTTGTTFTVTTSYNYDAQKGLITIELWDPLQDVVLLKHTGQNISKVILPWVWEAGTYYIRVTNQAQAGQGAPYDYSLVMSEVPGDPASQCDSDVFESNNGFDQSALIGCGLQGATLCKGDIDVYRVELQDGQTLTATLDHAESALKMSLFGDPDSNPISTKSGNGSLVHTAVGAQQLYMMVSAKSDPLDLVSFDYTLFMDGVPGVDLIVTNSEPFFEEVYQGEDNLLDFEVHNTCIDTTTPFETTVWLSQDQWLDEADVDIAYLGVPAIEGKSFELISEKVTVPFSTAPGAYWLLVEADSSGIVDESNEGNNVGATTMSVAKLCLPDAYEPNDVLTAEAPYAPQLQPPSFLGELALCPYELDWFSVYVPPGKSMTVSVLFDPSEGDLDLRLYDPTYSTTLPVVVAATGSSEEVASYQPPIGGWVLMRVNGFNGSSANYALDVSFE